jgi:ubiquinone/menaquinone biosynthesis C-methylase UbiE
MSNRNLLFDKQVADYYEEWYGTPDGKRYDRVEKSLLSRALGDLQPGTLLEVGCGTGHFARLFAELGFVVVGVDISAPMLSVAQRLDSDVEYVLADACSLPFQDDSFDVVAFVTTLEFLNRPLNALAEALRVGRKLLLVGFLNRCSLTAIRRRVRGWFRKNLFFTAKFYSARNVMRLVEKAAAGSDVKLKLLWIEGSWMNLCGLTIGAFGVTSAHILKEEER